MKKQTFITLSKKKNIALGALFFFFLAVGSYIGFSYKMPESTSYPVEITYKAGSPYGEESGLTIPASCESGTWRENGGYHLDGVNSAPSFCPGQSCSSNPNACGQQNFGTLNAAGTCSATTPANPAGYGSVCQGPANACGMTNPGTQTCSGSCSATVAPANSLCPPPTLSVTLTPTTIGDKGTYSLKYSSANTRSCDVTFPDGRITPNMATSYDWGAVSGTRGPATLTWSVTCLGLNESTVTKTATLSVKSQCDTVVCPIPGPVASTTNSAATPIPACRDTADNDGDGLIDAADPGCKVGGVYDPNRNTEINREILCIDAAGNPTVCPVQDPTTLCSTNPTLAICSTSSTADTAATITLFDAKPKVVRHSGSATLSWEVAGLTGTRSCSLEYYRDGSALTPFGTITSANAVSTKSTGPLTEKTTYRLTCGNAYQEAVVSIYSLYEN
jgi:hypothetical protein